MARPMPELEPVTTADRVVTYLGRRLLVDDHVGEAIAKRPLRKFACRGLWYFIDYLRGAW